RHRRRSEAAGAARRQRSSSRTVVLRKPGRQAHAIAPEVSSCNIGSYKEARMDLGIAGRKAIVCASSRGLGRGCAMALADAGCDVVINGRDERQLEKTAAEIRAKARGKINAVAADVSTPDGQAALFKACPEPDILVNNNAGP